MSLFLLVGRLARRICRLMESTGAYRWATRSRSSARLAASCARCFSSRPRQVQPPNPRHLMKHGAGGSAIPRPRTSGSTIGMGIGPLGFREGTRSKGIGTGRPSSQGSGWLGTARTAMGARVLKCRRTRRLAKSWQSKAFAPGHWPPVDGTRPSKGGRACSNESTEANGPDPPAVSGRSRDSKA